MHMPTRALDAKWPSPRLVDVAVILTTACNVAPSSHSRCRTIRMKRLHTVPIRSRNSRHTRLCVYFLSLLFIAAAAPGAAIAGRGARRILTSSL